MHQAIAARRRAKSGLSFATSARIQFVTMHARRRKHGPIRTFARNLSAAGMNPMATDSRPAHDDGSMENQPASAS